MKEKIAYLNGFLRCIAQNNSGTNCHCDFFIAKVESRNTVDETIQAEFASFLEWMITIKNANPADCKRVHYERLENWQDHVKQTIYQWFFNMEFSPKMSDHYQEQCTEGLFFKLLEDLLKGDVQVWQILDGSYDIQYMTYMIKDENDYYFLHFGWCD